MRASKDARKCVGHAPRSAWDDAQRAVRVRRHHSEDGAGLVTRGQYTLHVLFRAVRLALALRLVDLQQCPLDAWPSGRPVREGAGKSRTRVRMGLRGACLVRVTGPCCRADGECAERRCERRLALAPAAWQTWTAPPGPPPTRACHKRLQRRAWATAGLQKRQEREAHPKLQVLAPKLVTFRLGNGLAGAENNARSWELRVRSPGKSLGAPRTRLVKITDAS